MQSDREVRGKVVVEQIWKLNTYLQKRFEWMQEKKRGQHINTCESKFEISDTTARNPHSGIQYRFSIAHFRSAIKPARGRVRICKYLFEIHRPISVENICELKNKSNTSQFDG
jgi:hypothetical protein